MPTRPGTRKKASEAFVAATPDGTRIAPAWTMQLALDCDQTEVLREILEHELTELRFESARADVHEYRERLHGRERIVVSLLEELGVPENEMLSEL
jgi:hypothetical protein